MSEGFDWGPVDAKHAQFVELGITDTWGARFLTSLVTTRQPPRGGGIGILEEILKTDLDQVRADLARLLPLQGKAGVDEDWLSELIFKVKKGNPLKTWHFQRLETIERKVATPEGAASEHMYDLVDKIRLLAKRRSSWYWGQRSSQYRRMKTIFVAAENREGLQTADIEWLISLFKGDMAELNNSKHKVGDLCFTRSGEMAMVVSDPYVHSEQYCVVHDVLINGVVVPHSATSLLKRKLKKEKN